MVDVIARLRLKGEEFSRESDRLFGGLERRAQAAASRVSSAFDKLTSFGNLTIAGLGAGAFAAAAQRALDYASSLGETSQQLGVTTRDLQAYRYVASQVGIEQDEMDRSLAKLTLNLGKASLGAEKPSKAFQALGIDVRDANGHVRTAGDVIPLIAEALSKVEDPARRAALEVELFGKTGQRLDTFLAGGSKQVRELTDNAAKLGLVLSDDVINQADAAADKISEMRQVLDAQFANAIAQNANGLVLLADGAMRVAASFPEAIRQASGLARVLQTEGLIGYLRSDGTRLDRAATPFGNVKNQAADVQRAAADLERAVAGGGSRPAIQQRRNILQQQLKELKDAKGEYDRFVAASRAPKLPQPANDGIGDILAGAGAKPKAGASGKSDAVREAERKAEAGARLTKSLDEQIAKADDLARLERIRAEQGDREADAQEAISRVREQNNEIVAKSIPQLQAAYGWTAQQAQAEKDRVRSLEDAAELTSKGAFDAKAAAEADQKREQARQEGLRESQRILEEQQRKQEESVRDLAGFYRDAFDGGSGSIWKKFKDLGKDAIAEIAARYTLALVSGKSTSFADILSSAQGSGSPLDGALRVFRSIGGGGSGDYSKIAPSVLSTPSLSTGVNGIVAGDDVLGGLTKGGGLTVAVTWCQFPSL